MLSMRIKNNINDPPESFEQERFVAFVEWNKGRIFHIPNGFHVQGADPAAVAREVTKLHKQGLRNGVPDLFIPVARGVYHGLFIEMKRARSGKATPEQRDWLIYLEEAGYCAVVAHGAVAAETVYKKYMSLKAGEKIE